MIVANDVCSCAVAVTQRRNHSHGESEQIRMPGRNDIITFSL